MCSSPSDGRFTPPAPGPVARLDLSAFAKAITRPIEGWPREIFENTSWRPPIPGLPVFIMDPQAIREIFADQADAFSHGALWRRMMRPVWGDGLVVADGAAWRWQRRAVAPAFRPAQMHALAGPVTRTADAALARWLKAGRIDLAQETALVALDVLLDAVLSGGEGFDRAELQHLVGAFAAQALQTRLSYFFAPDSYHEHRRNRPVREADVLRAQVSAMVARRRLGPPRGDLVDLLMGARDPETGQAMDDDLLRDNLLGFITAGHETTAVAMIWMLYLATAHAPTLARLRAEAEAIAGDGPVRPEHVEHLVFARQVVSESLRLYPVNHLLTRICIRNTSVGGVSLKAGERVLIPIYALHRHRALWTDPDAFDPDRFGAGAPGVDRYAYLPFGAGGRVCLGAAFATTELTVLLATFVRGADFEVEPGHRVWPRVQSSTVRPEGGLPMRVRPRA